MVDDANLFEWRDAVLLREGAEPVDHRVPLVNERVPGEFDRPRDDGSYDRWRLVIDDGSVATYEWVGIEGA